MRNWICATALSVGAIFGLSAIAAAQDAYPSKPVQIVLPQPTGGGSDLTARLLAEHLSNHLGQRFFIDNRPGAGGEIGAKFVADAAADGYTLFFAPQSTMTARQFFYDSMIFDPDADFDPITVVAQNYITFMVRPDLPIHDIGDLVAYAKEHPGQLSVANPGAGTASHLFAEWLKLEADIDFTLVPFQGGGEALNAILGGHIDMAFDTGQARTYIENGDLRAIAVSTAERQPDLPEVSSMSEAGLPSQVGWFGLFAPAGTPAEVITLLSETYKEIAQDPAFVDQLANYGSMPGTTATPEEFAAFIDEEEARFQRIAEETGIRLN